MYQRLIKASDAEIYCLHPSPTPHPSRHCADSQPQAFVLVPEVLILPTSCHLSVSLPQAWLFDYSSHMGSVFSEIYKLALAYSSAQIGLGF